MFEKSKEKPPKYFWVVMKAHGWESLSVAGIALQTPEEGPHRLIPVFNTYEQAVKWAGTDEHVRQVKAG